MPYIGNQSTNSYSSMVKQDLTGASGASVTLSHPVANANEVELYINNVRQEPTTSYTTNGTTLNFVGYTVAASDDIYVIFSGKALQTIVPPDGSVSTAKIADSAVDLTSKVTGVLPLANGGTGATSFAEANSVIETWYYDDQDRTHTSGTVLSQTWTRKTNDLTANKNGGMSVSSGIFTFPSTGIWSVSLSLLFYASGSTTYHGVRLGITTDNSSYTNAALAYTQSSSSNRHSNIVLPYVMNVTDTTNQKIKWIISAQNQISVRGGSTEIGTKATFIKLCPSV